MGKIQKIVSAQSFVLALLGIMALAFSINFNKKFILLKDSQRMERMDSLVNLLRVQNHIVKRVDEVENVIKSNESNETLQMLHTAREESLLWIEEHIINAN